MHSPWFANPHVCFVAAPRAQNIVGQGRAARPTFLPAVGREANSTASTKSTQHNHYSHQTQPLQTKRCTWYASILALSVCGHLPAVPPWARHIKHPEGFVVPCHQLGAVRGEDQGGGSSNFVSIIVRPVAGTQLACAGIPHLDGLALWVQEHGSTAQHSMAHQGRMRHSCYQCSITGTGVNSNPIIS